MIAALALLMQAPVDDPTGYRAWTQCTIEQRAAFVTSNEPVDQLAIAVLSACSRHERAAYTMQLSRAPTGRGPVYAQRIVTGLIESHREDLRASLIEYFVRARLPQK